MYLSLILFTLLSPLFAGDLNLEVLLLKPKTHCSGDYVQSSDLPLGQTTIDYGFYVVTRKTSGQITYTREAVFNMNKCGEYANKTGQVLQVLPIGQDSDPANLFTLNTPNIMLSPAATTKITFKMQLPVTAVTGNEFVQPVQVFDSLGMSHTVKLIWTKTVAPDLPPSKVVSRDTNRYWKLVISTEGGSVAPAQDGSDYSGTMGSKAGFIASFDASGNPAQWGYPVAGGSAITFPYAPNVGIVWDNRAVSDIVLNLGTVGRNDGMTSLGDKFRTISPPVVDGCGCGYFSRISVNPRRIVSVTYTNGQTVPYAIIPLVVFDNPDELFSDGGGLGIKARLVL